MLGLCYLYVRYHVRYKSIVFECKLLNINKLDSSHVRCRDNHNISVNFRQKVVSQAL